MEMTIIHDRRAQTPTPACLLAFFHLSIRHTYPSTAIVP